MQTLLQIPGSKICLSSATEEPTRTTAASERFSLYVVLDPTEVGAHSCVDDREFCVSAPDAEGDRADDVEPAGVDVEVVEGPAAVTLRGEKTC